MPLRTHYRVPSTFLLATILFVLALAAPALAEDIENSWTIDARELSIANLIGAVEVTAARGDEFTIEAVVRGEDAEDGLITFVQDGTGDVDFAVVFPLEDHTKYVYPELGSGKTTIHYRVENGEEGGSWLKKMLNGNGTKVTVRGKGGGLEVWVDLKIGVPEGRSLAMRQGVGQIVARAVEGELNLDTNSGSIAVKDLKGDLLADTGSGRVTAKVIEGDVSIDTGSGSVEVSEVTGDKVHVDTGSGSVKVQSVVCSNLHVDTGSGRVSAEGIETDKAKIDTGSGSVVLQLDRMGDGRFIIDTGSGSIELVLPDDASARIHADTGSGSVRTKIDGAEIQHKERDELRMTVGDGEARVTLDAGSGSITIRSL